MPKLNSISKSLFAFTLGFAMVTSSFSSLSVSAQANNSSSSNLFLQDTVMPFANPKINLIQNSFVYNNTTNQWENKAQSQTWQEKNCADLYSQGIKGIADYEDGASMERYKTYPNPTSIRESYKQRGRFCNYFNEKAANLVNYCLHEKISVQTYEGSLQPQPVCSIPAGRITPANNPVYAYQYTYQYNFPENLKSSYSEGYRKMTGMEGDYDGVMWTYTFYTHREATPNSVCLPVYPSDPSACTTIYQLGAFKPWENPSANNGNGGWIIYGVKNGSSNNTGIYTTTIQNSPYPGKNLVLTYNKNTKKLDFQGEVVVGNSGCWTLGTNHAFVIKPDSSGMYNNFKIFYETRATGFGPCTANIPTENLQYTQDMSGLNATGEQFLIDYITQNKFKVSDVSSYTGMMPIG